MNTFNSEASPPVLEEMFLSVKTTPNSILRTQGSHINTVAEQLYHYQHQSYSNNYVFACIAYS